MNPVKEEKAYFSSETDEHLKDSIFFKWETFALIYLILEKKF